MDLAKKRLMLHPAVIYDADTFKKGSKSKKSVGLHRLQLHQAAIFSRLYTLHSRQSQGPNLHGKGSSYLRSW